MPDYGGYDVLVVPYRNLHGPSGGPWLIRCYDRTGQHIHSAEGGVPLEIGLREVQRAIEDDQQERIAYVDEAPSPTETGGSDA